MNNYYLSGYFENNPYIRGMASTFDLFGSIGKNELKSNSFHEDRKALMHDSMVIGNDFRNIIGSFKGDGWGVSNS